MATIDNINTNIISKIGELKKITSIYAKYSLDEKDNSAIESFQSDLDDILTTYELGSIEILREYYDMTTVFERKQDLYAKYMTFLSTENIQGRIKRIYNYCVKLKKYEVDEPELYEAFRNFEYTNIDTHYQDEVSKICGKCKIAFVIESKTSELVCNRCGQSEKLWGTVFEDEQFFYQEGQRTKHGKYDPAKHCRFWIDRIQAKESADRIDEVVDQIKMCMKRDQIWLERLNYEMVRKYLKEIGKTCFNEHIPLIRKIITKKEPAQLTDHELKLINMYFCRVVQIYNRTKPDGKPNFPYHPFFIYKIIEQILKKPEDARRKADILSTIHLQSRNTLIVNDILWKDILKYIPEFEYISTDGSR